MRSESTPDLERALEALTITATTSADNGILLTPTSTDDDDVVYMIPTSTTQPSTTTDGDTIVSTPTTTISVASEPIEPIKARITLGSYPNEPVITRYFDRFPNFKPNHEAPIREEFGRLAVFMNWKKKTGTYESQRLECFSSEYEFFHKDQNDSNLQAWQDLCREIAGIEDAPSSVTKCQKVLKGFYVNIFDIIDCKRAGKKVEPVFTSFKKFRAHMNKKKKYFPIQATKKTPSRGAALVALF